MKRLIGAVCVLSFALSTNDFPVGTNGEAASGQWGGIPFEVWTMDQSDVGVANAGRLYIYPGLWTGDRSLIGAPDVIDFGEAAQGVGDGPGSRPHMIEFNSLQTHAIIANVRTGHLYIMRAMDRKVVASIDLGLQVHHAAATDDGQLIIAAKQNDKKLGLIRTNYLIDRYSYNPAEDLDLGALQDAGHPDNAPICPVLSGRKAYITLRGGGLFIVDISTTPMRILKSFGRDEVAPAGCGGVVFGGKVYINSGTPTSSNLYVFDDATNTLVKTIALSSAGTDGHGMTLVGGGRYLWMNNRGEGDNILVIETAGDTLLGTVTGFGVAPDIMASAPAGDLVFVTLRGPRPLTGDPHAAQGMTPGVAAIRVINGGTTGQLAFFSPIGSQAPDSPNDPHGIAVRLIGVPNRY